MGLTEAFSLYLKWLIPLLILAFISAIMLTIPILTLICFFSILVVPADRVRVSMLKKQQSIPSKKLATKLVLIFSIVPIIISIYIGLSMDASNGSERFAAIALSLGVFFLVPGLFLCIQFFSKWTWTRALEKYKKVA